MQIVEASEADVAAIDALVKLLHGPDAAGFKPVRQRSRTFVAKSDDGVAVGFAICTLTDYGFNCTGNLEELAVAESEQRRGTGRALVAACEAWLVGEGADVIFVSILAGAEGFYAGLGYRPCTGPWFYRSLDTPT